MKKLFSFLVVLMLTGATAQLFAQTNGGFGIRGGVNFNSNGNYFKDAGVAWGDPMNNLGYNLGLYTKIMAGPIFLRPELNYTNLRSELNNNQLRTQRLDLPVLVGVNILGPVFSAFAGPSAHYYLQDQLRDYSFEKINAGYQFGFGVNLGNLGLDLRYERVLNGQKINIDNVFTGQGDFRFQQLIFGLSVKF